MGWEKRGKRFIHFGMCSFLSFLFLKILQDAINKLVVTHESEELMLELQV
jgi:hypothetical protein